VQVAYKNATALAFHRA